MEKVSACDVCDSARLTPMRVVVPDGYGLSYSIDEHYVRWTITSLKRDSATLKHYLAEAATETRFVLERAEREGRL